MKKAFLLIFSISFTGFVFVYGGGSSYLSFQSDHSAQIRMPEFRGQGGYGSGIKRAEFWKRYFSLKNSILVQA